MSFILKLHQVTKAFGTQQVLKPLSFEVKEGERICILGPSGCGKSTLLQLVAGLLPMDSGHMEMAGRIVEGHGAYVPPEHRPINMVFQDYALWPHMNVKQNIEYGMKRRKLSQAERNDRLRQLEELLKLQGLLERLPAQLSGGQQQRVGIARALATKPQLLLMDEPLSNLDVKLRTDMRGELAQLLGELSIATLYVTHDRMEAFTIADRILVLREGRIDQLGRPAELFERPASPWAAQLMGYHNRLNVNFVGETHPELETALIADHRLRGRRITPITASRVGVMLLHPDHMTLLEEGEDSGKYPESINRLQAKVVQCIYEGTAWRIIAAAADGQRLHVFHPYWKEPDSSITLCFPAEHTMLYGDSDKSQSMEEGEQQGEDLQVTYRMAGGKRHAGNE